MWNVPLMGDSYHIKKGQNYQTEKIHEIEPDVSAACYFYAMAALTGGRTVVKNVHQRIRCREICDF